MNPEIGALATRFSSNASKKKNETCDAQKPEKNVTMRPLLLSSLSFVYHSVKSLFLRHSQNQTIKHFKCKKKKMLCI